MPYRRNLIGQIWWIDATESRGVQEMEERMRRNVVKRILPMLMILMLAMASICSAEDWQYLGREDGSDRDYYVDTSSAWYDGENGGGIARVVSVNSGLSATFTVRFINEGGGLFDVTITDGKAYDANGNVLYSTPTNIEQVAKPGTMLSKGCSALIAISEMRDK